MNIKSFQKYIETRLTNKEIANIKEQAKREKIALELSLDHESKLTFKKK